MGTALYMIDASGIPLFHLVDEENLQNAELGKDPYLFSGVLSAIMTFLEDLKQGQLRKFQTEKLQIHIYNKDGFAVVFITENQKKIRQAKLNKLLQRMHLEFMFFYISTKRDDNLRIINTKELELLEKRLTQLLHEWEKQSEEENSIQEIRESLW